MPMRPAMVLVMTTEVVVTVASGANTRITRASFTSPNASIPASADGLKMPTVCNPIPTSRATTNVLSTPLARLLVPRLTSTTIPMHNTMPGVVSSAGALAGSLTDVGISDQFIKEVREKVTPGTSALFVMTSDAVQDRVAEAFAGANAELMATKRSNEQQASLREVFAD